MPYKNKKLTLSAKVLLGITSLLFVFAGIQKFTGGWDKLIANSFPPWFVVLLGLFWLAAAVKIWFRKARYATLILAAMVMCGALAYHVVVDGAFGANLISQLVYLVWIGIVLWKFHFFRVIQKYQH